MLGRDGLDHGIDGAKVDIDDILNVRRISTCHGDRHSRPGTGETTNNPAIPCGQSLFAQRHAAPAILLVWIRNDPLIQQGEKSGALPCGALEIFDHRAGGRRPGRTSRKKHR